MYTSCLCYVTKFSYVELPILMQYHQQAVHVYLTNVKSLQYELINFHWGLVSPPCAFTRPHVTYRYYCRITT